MGFPSTWPEEAIAILRQGWETDGASSTQIANELNQKGYTFTRNAIIGKAHRLKLVPLSAKKKELSQRTVKAYKTPHVRKYRQHYRTKPTSSKPMEVPVPNDNRAILLTHAKEHNCRAIIGYIDGKCSQAVCCGEQTVTRTTYGSSRLIRLSWCAFHKAKYFIEPKRGR